MEMIWCQSCKTVIWAYDHAEPSDRMGAANSFNLPCPLCGHKSNFSGLGIPNKSIDKNINQLRTTGLPVYDKWSYMKHLAFCNNVEWNPSGDNSWFRPGTHITLPSILQPNHGDWTL